MFQKGQFLKDLWVPVSGAIAQQRQVEAIANNIANVNTAGFKKDRLAFREYLTEIEKGTTDINLPHKEWAPEDFYKSYGAENAFVEINGSYTDHQQGQLVPTKNPLDVAIQGDGFFEVLTPNGIRYTRRGNFSLSSDGSVVTNQGYPVLNKMNNGNLAQASPDQLPAPQDRSIKVSSPVHISINAQGEIFLKDQIVGKLSVVEFKDVHALKKEGETYFQNEHIENRTEATKSTIYQGFVEQSNVNAVEEMSSLIKANRQFESIQRVIKAYDNIASKEVNEISKF